MRGYLKMLLLAAGILAMLLGVWWVCKGTGMVPVGFMANHMTWAYRGLGLAVGGLLIVVASRRI